MRVDVPWEFGQLGGPAVRRSGGSVVRRSGGPAVTAWLAGLPEPVERICARWDLRPAAPIRYGGMGAVLPVSRSGRAHALKLRPPDEEIGHAVPGLEIW